VPYCGSKGRIGSAHQTSDYLNSRQLSFRQTGFSETRFPATAILGNLLSYSAASQAGTFGRGLDRNTFDDGHR